MINIPANQFKIWHKISVKCQERNWCRKWRYRGTNFSLRGNWNSVLYGSRSHSGSSWGADFDKSVSPFTGSGAPSGTYWTYYANYINPYMSSGSWSATRSGSSDNLTATLSF